MSDPDCIPGYHHGCGVSDRSQVFYYYSDKVELDEDPEESGKNSFVSYMVVCCILFACLAISAACKAAATAHNDPVRVMNRRGETFDQFMDR